MPRNIDTSLSSAISSGFFIPFFAVELTLKSQTAYLWTGSWNLAWGGNTYTGLGDLGQIAGMRESAVVEAIGTSVTLSGINNNLLQEALEDIQLGAPASIIFGALNPTTMQPIGTPYPLFVGLMDKPTVQHGVDSCSITIALESHLLRLNQGTQRRYTSADQRRLEPTSTIMQWVESLNDLSLQYGS
jgi:hypothetical protein